MAKDHEAIRGRLTGDSESRLYRHSTKVDRYFSYTDGTSKRAYREMLPHDVCIAGIVAFEALISQLLSNVRLTLSPHLARAIPDRYGAYKPTQSWRCFDLRSAIYLQFYLMITDSRPVRYCENPVCRMPFLAGRKDKHHCNDSCRSNARHYR